MFAADSKVLILMATYMICKEKTKHTEYHANRLRLKVSMMILVEEINIPRNQETLFLSCSVELVSSIISMIMNNVTLMI